MRSGGGTRTVVRDALAVHARHRLRRAASIGAGRAWSGSRALAVHHALRRRRSNAAKPVVHATSTARRLTAGRSLSDRRTRARKTADRRDALSVQADTRRAGVFHERTRVLGIALGFGRAAASGRCRTAVRRCTARGTRPTAASARFAAGLRRVPAIDRGSTACDDRPSDRAPCGQGVNRRHVDGVGKHPACRGGGSRFRVIHAENRGHTEAQGAPSCAASSLESVFALLICRPPNSR